MTNLIKPKPFGDRNMKILSFKDLQNILGLSRSLIWRLEKEGKFPNRRQISEKRVGWLSTEIDEWIKNRPTVKIKSEGNK